MYDEFFRDVESFLINNNLSKPNDLKGMDSWELEEIEMVLNKTFGNAMKSFFSFFGRKIHISGKGSMPLNFNKKTLLYAHNESSLYDRSVYTEIAKIKYLGLDENILRNSLSDVILIGYDEPGGCFTLVQEKEDNPIIYYYYGQGDLVHLDHNNSRL